MVKNFMVVVVNLYGRLSEYRNILEHREWKRQ